MKLLEGDPDITGLLLLSIDRDIPNFTRFRHSILDFGFWILDWLRLERTEAQDSAEFLDDSP